MRKITILAFMILLVSTTFLTSCERKLNCWFGRHTEVIDRVVPPSCDKTGLTTGSHCRDCDKVLIAQETVAAIGHNPTSKEAVEPSCAGNGFTEGVYCSRCGMTITGLEVIPGGHEVVIYEGVAPTCTSDGLTEGAYCTVCDTVLAQQEVILGGHNLVDDTCTNCGKHASRGLSYSLNYDRNSYTVADIGSCTDTDIIIPSFYNGLPVTAIGNAAFEYCFDIASVTIPDSVTSIGYAAFYKCWDLTYVAMGNGVTSIGTYAFSCCFTLPSITISESIITIAAEAFVDCSSLVNVTIGNDVISIGSEAFIRCTNLTKINFEGTIEEWQAVRKYDNWDASTASYIIYCTDGTISKDGTATYY